MPRRLTALASAAALTCLLAACSTLEESKIDYKSASQAPTLEIPPDLTQLKRDTRYQVAGTASALASASTPVTRTANDAGTATNQAGDAKIVRIGSQRYMVVQRSADSVWEPLREFWKDNGFSYTIEQQQLGLLETEWAENRAKIPQDFIRRTLGKVLDGLYSSGERDKFRTRIERNSAGGVDIFVTHRGMREEYKDAAKTGTIWIPRANDSELEAEFLTRLMIKLGVSAEQAKIANAPAQSTNNKTALISK